MSRSQTIVINDQNRMYRLWLGHSGEFYLTSVAGGVGMYEVTIKLNQQEADRFSSEGKPYADELASHLSRECLTTFRHRLEHPIES